MQIAAALVADSQDHALASRQHLAAWPKIGSRFFDLVADIPTGSKESVEVSK